MSNFSNSMWGYIISGTIIESERARLRADGFVYEKPVIKTKRLKYSVAFSLMFGAIGMLYVSISSAIIMFLMNTLLFTTTVGVVYFTGNFAWLFTGFYISKVCTLCLSVYYTEAYNKKVLGEK